MKFGSGQEFLRSQFATSRRDERRRRKLVALQGRPWELYDIEADPTEMNNLAAENVDRVTRMARAWDDWADRCFVKGGNKQK